MEERVFVGINVRTTTRRGAAAERGRLRVSNDARGRRGDNRIADGGCADNRALVSGGVDGP